MPISIDGTGSITGLTAGGLPDLSIATADLAASAVTTAKVADANITAAKLDGAQSGSAPIYGARAWVNFNGTSTVAIRASGNVTSITDNNTGDYTVNLTTAMSDANYSVVASVITNSNASSSFVRGVDIFSTAAVTTGSVRVNSRAGGSGTFDADGVFVAIFR